MYCGWTTLVDTTISLTSSQYWFESIPSIRFLQLKYTRSLYGYETKTHDARIRANPKLKSVQSVSIGRQTKIKRAQFLQDHFLADTQSVSYISCAVLVLWLCFFSVVVFSIVLCLVTVQLLARAIELYIFLYRSSQHTLMIAGAL